MHATVDQNGLNVFLMQFRNVKSVIYGPVALGHLPEESLKDYNGNNITIIE